MTDNRVGDSFTFVSVTRGTGGYCWRYLTGRWRFGEDWSYIEVAGQSDVTQGRSEAMSRWLLSTETEWSVWVDDDMWLSWDGLLDFCRTAVEHADDVDFLAGVYVPKIKGGAKFTTMFRDDVVTLGLGGGLVPLKGCGFGLVAVKRDLCLKIAADLPRVRYQQTGHPGWPFFLGMLVPEPGDEECPYRHSGEDYAFCARAIQAGGRLFADTRIRLGHEGSYIYNWEDAGQVVELTESIRARRTANPWQSKPDVGDAPPENNLPESYSPTCADCRRFTQSAQESRGHCLRRNGTRDTPRPDGPICDDFKPRPRKPAP